MVLEVLRRLLSGRKQKRGRKVYAVLDARGEYVTLGDGERIPVKNIISVDPASGIIIYRSRDGKIKKARVVGEPEAEERRVGVALATAILLLAALLPAIPVGAQVTVTEFYILVSNPSPYDGTDVLVPVFLSNTSFPNFDAVASAPSNLHFELLDGTPLFWYLCYADAYSIRLLLEIPYIPAYGNVLVRASLGNAVDQYLNETVVFDKIIDFSDPNYPPPEWVNYQGTWEVVNGELHVAGGYSGWLAWSLPSPGSSSPLVVVEFRDEVRAGNAGFSLFLIENSTHYDTANLDGNVVLYVTAARNGAVTDLAAAVVEYQPLDVATMCFIGPVLTMTGAKTCFSWDAKFYQLWFDVADVGTIAYQYVGVGYYIAESSFEDIYIQRILVGRTVPGGLVATVLSEKPLITAEHVEELDQTNAHLIDAFLFIGPAAFLVLYMLPRIQRRPGRALIELSMMSVIEVLVFAIRNQLPARIVSNETATTVEYTTNPYAYLHLLLALVSMALAFVALAHVMSRPGRFRIV